ncbi:MAG: hypothetical protein V3W22_05375 [Thermoplasmata archaeon]
MVHKILISFISKPDGKLGGVYLQSLLKTGFLVTHTQYTLHLKAENLSDERFPGGSIESIYLKTGSSVSTLAKNVPVPPIDAHSTVEIGQYAYLSFEEGPGWLNCSIKSVDGEEVEHYREAEGESLKDWSHVLISVNREQVMMVDLLRDIRTRLEK